LLYPRGRTKTIFRAVARKTNFRSAIRNADARQARHSPALTGETVLSQYFAFYGFFRIFAAPKNRGLFIIYLLTIIYANNSTIGSQRTRGYRSQVEISCVGCLSSEAWRMPESLYDDSQEAELRYA
jgi:hypothetical protein